MNTSLTCSVLSTVTDYGQHVQMTANAANAIYLLKEGRELPLSGFTNLVGSGLQALAGYFRAKWCQEPDVYNPRNFQHTTLSSLSWTQMGLAVFDSYGLKAGPFTKNEQLVRSIISTAALFGFNYDRPTHYSQQEQNSRIAHENGLVSDMNQKLKQLELASFSKEQKEICPNLTQAKFKTRALDDKVQEAAWKCSKVLLQIDTLAKNLNTAYYTPYKKVVENLSEEKNIEKMENWSREIQSNILKNRNLDIKYPSYTSCKAAVAAANALKEEIADSQKEKKIIGSNLVQQVAHDVNEFTGLKIADKKRVFNELRKKINEKADDFLKKADQCLATQVI